MKISAWFLVPAAVLGGVAGSLLPSRSIVPPAVQPAIASAAVDTATLRADVRRVVAAELRSHAAPPQIPPVVEPPPPAEPTFEQREAFTRASSLVEGALAEGRWSSEDADALRQLGGELRPGDRFELTRALVVAVNEGRIRVEGDRPF